MFSITTMASSTTRPVASVIPNSVSVLIEKPKALTKAKVPISETGMVIAGNQRGPPVLQEQEDHHDDQHDRLQQRHQDLVDRVAHGRRRVEGDLVVQRRREAADSRLELGADAASSSSALASGSWKTPDADRVAAVEAEVERVVLGAELGAAHVPQQTSAPSAPRFKISCSNSRGSVNRPGARTLI